MEANVANSTSTNDPTTTNSTIILPTKLPTKRWKRKEKAAAPASPTTEANMATTTSTNDPAVGGKQRKRNKSPTTQTTDSTTTLPSTSTMESPTTLTTLAQNTLTPTPPTPAIAPTHTNARTDSSNLETGNTEVC